jgi:hypothetical protein
MNINIASTGEILSFGHSFFLQEIPDLHLSDNISEKQAYEKFCDFLIELEESIPDEVVRPIRKLRHTISLFEMPGHEGVQVQAEFSKSLSKVTKVLVHTEQGGIDPCWNFEVELEDNWFTAYVSSNTGEILGYIDWVSEMLDYSSLATKSSYLVFPLGTNDPEDGPAEIRFGPFSDRASPLGWHRLAINQTCGNNVIAQENHDLYSDWEYNYRPYGGLALQFHYLFDRTKDPRHSVNASITNLFYWNNLLHDLFYEYGFDEKAGNFQANNFDRGGTGGDPIIAHAQDGSGVCVTD